MPLIEGDNLASLVKKRGPLPPQEAVALMLPVVEAVHYAHQAGIIHRDLKPENILVDGQGRPRITDFGLAKHIGSASGMTAAGQILGTPAFMAPEQARGGSCRAGPAADVYALGGVLFFLLTGRPPFTGSSVTEILLQVELSPPPSPRAFNPDISNALEMIVLCCLGKNPIQRYATAAALREALGVVHRSPSTPDVTPGTLAASRPASDALLRALHADLTEASSTPQEKSDTLSVGLPAQPVPQAAPRVIFSQRRLLLGLAVAAAFLTGIGLWLGVSWLIGHFSHALALPSRYTNSLGMEFVLVPRGKFFMGGGFGILDIAKEVEIPSDFYLGIYEVTQEEWHTVTGMNPSHFSRIGAGKDRVVDIPDEDLKRFPVENVSWDDAQGFLEKLNAHEGETGWVYRLPREAEWEYACRGGSRPSNLGYAYDFYFEQPTNNLLPEQANFAPEPRKGLQRTCKVGSYRPNSLGLHDMHGNVWEWCAEEEGTPQGASPRGGSWLNDANTCRAAFRYVLFPSSRSSSLGLRLARVSVGGAGR
jgi:formylglycine-generating enzyme required for sulfatase activity